jgi:lysophospholipase L1-like esterase
MPNALAPPVWWVLIGANDLSVGQCSEEAVVLGILCLAEYIAAQRPGSTVVINSILPALTTVKPSVKTAHFKTFDLFPSIRVVNEQLERFCKNHTNFRFFDATPLFFDGAIPPSTDKSKRKKSMPSLKTSLVSDDGQLTVAGHKVWADAMVMELKKLLYSDNDLGHISGPTDDMFSGDDYLVGGDDYRN